MNRIDRITAILIQLQSRRVVKAQDIAQRFNISLRTVYRDVKTLEEAGIPVIGEAGVGYSIMEGYRLPPVMFSKEEATALLTAEKLVGKLTDVSTCALYESAMFKIRSVLRLTDRDHLERMEQHIAVVESPHFKGHKNEPAFLQQILKGISEKTVLNIGYFATHSQTHTQRNIEPVGIFLMGRYWYLIGWCALRKDYRTFRVDQIRQLLHTDLHFNKQHPTLQSFLTKISKEKELHTVVISVDKDVMRYFGEQKYYNGFVSQEEKGEQVEMSFLTGSLMGFSKFFLPFSEHAEIIAPAALKDIVRNSLEKAAKRLNNPIQ